MLTSRRWLRNPPVLAVRGARWIIYPLLLVIAFPLAERAWLRLQPYNGFAVDPASDVAARIEAGGPGRDDIPALDEPASLRAGDADFLAANDHVLGLVAGGEARAYPLRILNWHEVVNDRLGAEAVLITWCPLCRSGLAFKPVIAGEHLRFGVSGLLYRGNLLMYDRDSRSLWSQISGEAISGERRGQRLQRIAVAHETWANWRRRYPHTSVLSPDTGHARDYASEPYADLQQRASAARSRSSDGLPEDNALVIGVELAGLSRAWPLQALALVAPAGEIEDRLADRTLRIRYDAIARTAQVFDAEGEAVPATLVYWSVWRRFYPDTGLWRGSS